jgi:DNA polymerase-3 subunit beta
MTRVTVPRDRLAPALERVATVAASRSNIVILNTVKVVADRDGLTLTGTDTDALLEEKIDAPSHEPSWAGCVDAARLAGFVSSLPRGADLALTGGEDQLEIRQGRSAAQMPVMPARDFPAWDDASEAEVVTIAGDQLAAALQAVRHAIGESETRYYLNGAYLHAENSGAIAVAMDGHRLALRRLPVAWPEGRGVIVPRTTCGRLLHLLRGISAELTIKLATASISVSSGAWTLRSKLISGEYPDYSRILPPRSPSPVTVDRATMLAAVGRIAEIAHGTHEQSVQLEATPGELHLSGGTRGQFGSAEDVLECVAQASAVQVILQSKYLADALQSLDGPTVEVHICDPMQPVWLCAAGEAHDGIVIMPMRG